MTHSMNLRSAPFEKIKSGQKTIELRLNDEKRSKINTGDKIEFINIDTGKRLTAAVVALHRFESFAELYKVLPLDKCGYKSGERALPSDMDEYYTPEQQKRYGVLGIEIQVKNGLQG